MEYRCMHLQVCKHLDLRFSKIWQRSWEVGKSSKLYTSFDSIQYILTIRFDSWGLFLCTWEAGYRRGVEAMRKTTRKNSETRKKVGHGLRKYRFMQLQVRKNNYAVEMLTGHISFSRIFHQTALYRNAISKPYLRTQYRILYGYTFYFRNISYSL